jgi:hypothetical protein
MYTILDPIGRYHLLFLLFYQKSQIDKSMRTILDFRVHMYSKI